MNKVQEFIVEHKDHYIDALSRTIAEREMLLMEHSEFKEDIDRTLRITIRTTIVDHVTKELAIDTESVYNELEEIDLFNFLEVYP